MSHPCRSFPHFLTSSPSQHAAPLGPREPSPRQHCTPTTHFRKNLFSLLPEQLPQEPLPANATWSENNAKESLSDPEDESAGNPAHQHYHRLWAQRVYDRRDCDNSDDVFPQISINYMYRENLENKINKPRLLKKWRILANWNTKLTRSRDGRDVTCWEDVLTSSPRCTSTSPLKAYADSDLEDGELHKLLTSPLYAQRASGRPDALVIQEREVSAQTSHLSQDQRASGRPAALFSPKRNEQRNPTWSSVFGNANVSNLSETPLEGNKDHLLNRARTDPARREIHVESLNKCINDLQKKRRHKTGHYKTYNTNLSNLVKNKPDCKRNYCEKRKLFEIPRFEVCTIWKNEESASTASWRNVDSKIKRESRDTSAAHFTIAAIARPDEFYEQFWKIPGYWIKFEWKIVSRIQSTWDDSEFSCFAQPRQKIAAWCMESIRSIGKRFWKSVFVWFTSRFSSKNFILKRAQKSRSNTSPT